MMRDMGAAGRRISLGSYLWRSIALFRGAVEAISRLWRDP